MKRWFFGLLVAAFFAGVAFVLSAIVQNIFRVYRNASGSADHKVPIMIAALVAGAAITAWFRATRTD